MKSISVRQDIRLFLDTPNYTGFIDLSISQKIIIVIKVLILYNIALFLVRLPILYLEKLDVVSKIQQLSTLQLAEIQTRNIDYKPYFIFSTLLFVPLLEEISFRLFQTRFRVNYFIISVSIILGLCVSYFFRNIFFRNILWIPNSYFLHSVIYYIYISILSALIGGVLYLFKTKIKKIEEFWNKHSGLIIYSTSILFAIAHMMNLKFENRDLFFMPLLLMPFLFAGLSLSYLRVRLGIIYSIALHFSVLALNFGMTELSIFLKAIHQ